MAVHMTPQISTDSRLLDTPPRNLVYSKSEYAVATAHARGRTKVTTRGSIVILYASFLFCGAAALMLGDALPVFRKVWNLTDAKCGLLLAVQFFGLFAGALLIRDNLRASMQFGFIVAGAGFAGLLGGYTHLHTLNAIVPIFFFLGLGIGLITTAVNLLAASYVGHPEQRGANLSLLNCMWSAGAMMSPLLCGWFLSHRSLRMLLLSFLVLNLMLFIGSYFGKTRDALSGPPTHLLRKRQGTSAKGIARFATIFCLYGGLELTLSGWLSTYALRYAGLTLAQAAYCTSCLWISFSVSRGAAGVILRYVPDAVVQKICLILTIIASISLWQANSLSVIKLSAAMIGFGIGPIFPITFATLASYNPTPRQAGVATSGTAIGQAVFPWVVGILSNSVGSLRFAMIVPTLLASALFLIVPLNLMSRRRSPTDTTSLAQ